MPSTLILAASIAIAVPLSPLEPGQVLRPRPEAIKPPRVQLAPHDSPDVIYVKFRDDAVVRLRDGRLDDLGTGQLAAARPMLEVAANTAAGGRWGWAWWPASIRAGG